MKRSYTKSVTCGDTFPSRGRLWVSKLTLLTERVNSNKMGISPSASPTFEMTATFILQPFSATAPDFRGL